MVEKNKFNYFPGLVVLCLSVLMGLLSYQDYGVSWDEPIQRGIGVVTYNYVFQHDPTLKTHIDRDLGTGYELPLIMIERVMKLTDSRDIYLMRHVVTHLFFLVSVFCGYILALRLFKNQYLALLAFVILAFTPRIYAHSYFNTKDIPFYCTFIIAFLAGHRAFEKDSPRWYLILGLVCGYATSIRAMGILLLPCFSLFLLTDLVRSIYLKADVRQAIIRLCVFVAGFCMMLYVCWPILWSAPFKYFAEEFNTLSHIWWDGNVFFQGRYINGRELPLNYLPVWIGITVPEIWLAGGILGIAGVVIAFVRKPALFLYNTQQRNFLLYLMCFAGPIAAVLLLKSVNYDDWRHLYFIYPPFVMLSLYGLHKLAQGKMKLLVVTACVVQMGFLASFMIRNHPFQQVYFNYLVSHKEGYLRKHFELDYWGCAYKNGIEYILAHDSSAQPIRVCGIIEPINNAIRLLPARDRARISPIDREGPADYYITNFRGHYQDFDYPKTIYQVQVLNSTIMRVYKVADDSEAGTMRSDMVQKK